MNELLFTPVGGVPAMDTTENLLDPGCIAHSNPLSLAVSDECDELRRGKDAPKYTR